MFFEFLELLSLRYCCLFNFIQKMNANIICDPIYFFIFVAKI